VSGTLSSVISALAGLVRWNIGNILLKLFILRNRKLEQEQLFKRSWTFVQRFHWLFSGRQLYRNRFQRDWKSFVLSALVSEVTQRHPSFVPEVITKNRHVLTEPAKLGSPIVLATIHTGVETSLNRMFEELGVKSSVLAASKGSPQRLSALFGLKGTVDLIGRSSDSFLIARRKMKDGKAICCCADFTMREAGTLYHNHYMAPGLFDFAKWAKARVIYAVPLVSELGEIIINLSAPGISEENSTAEELAQDFILFNSTITKEKYNWNIRSWSSLLPGSPKQYKKYCIARHA
jgi:hypothetical protein